MVRTMTLYFTVADNDNEDYKAEGSAEVSELDGMLIQKPWLDNDKTYNNFCDNIVPNKINNLPYNWYFDKPPREK